jgi:iron complex outermembrane receptor protein
VTAVALFLLLAFQSASLRVVVTADGQPVTSAQVVVAGVTTLTSRDGIAVTAVVPGRVEMTVVKEGFDPVTLTVTATMEAEQVVTVALDKQVAMEERITVSATRSDKRVEDQAMRVEVIDAEEIEEKQLMTPGDIVMMLNEMGGMRVQATSPSLGAASVRVQGMRGRYTRFLSDGLPLYGDVGGLGLLQIPPTDLGQVEVIKGVASALYGAGALGGVVDLISRRPAAMRSADALVNRTSRGGTDAVVFASQPLSARWSSTLLAGGHWQSRNDVDGDGWADLAGYARAVIRPRLFWRDDTGRSVFVTSGITWENRSGGTMDGHVLPVSNSPFVETLDTSSVDGGIVAQSPLARRYILTTRFSANRRRGDHGIGDGQERDIRTNVFAEAALRGSAPRQTWVAGAAFERATLAADARADLEHTYAAPALFAQDDVDVAGWLVVSASARVDAHNRFGTFVSPRASALVRRGGWNARASAGSGFFAPSALSEETEAAGITRLSVPAPLRAERGRSASLDITRTHGPVAITGTLFRYVVRDPVIVDRATYTLTNATDATVTAGFESVTTLRHEPFSMTATYTYVHSREGADRSEVPLTPRHSAGVVGMWERDGRGRVGVEAYYTGTQRLEDNPFRSRSAAYVLFGGLVEHAVGRVRLFANVENLAGVRQTKWDPLIRPARAVDGRWTVDAWAPLDGRVINGGVRVRF